MKTIIMAIACSLLIASTVSASPLPKNNQTSFSSSFFGEFTRFNAHKQHAGIALSWIYNDGGNMVISFKIERSYDGVNFEKIDEVAPSTDNRNQYKDNAVYPGYLHYRISACMIDGSVIQSNVEVVRIVRNG